MKTCDLNEKNLEDAWGNCLYAIDEQAKNYPSSTTNPILDFIEVIQADKELCPVFNGAVKILRPIKIENSFSFLRKIHDKMLEIIKSDLTNLDWNDPIIQKIVLKRHPTIHPSFFELDKDWNDLENREDLLSCLPNRRLESRLKSPLQSIL